MYDVVNFTIDCRSLKYIINGAAVNCSCIINLIYELIKLAICAVVMASVVTCV